MLEIDLRDYPYLESIVKLFANPFVTLVFCEDVLKVSQIANTTVVC